MDGLKEKKYLQTIQQRFDPIALAISTVGLLVVAMSVAGFGSKNNFIDIHGMIIVIGGTAASLLFQFDFTSTYRSVLVIVRSFIGTPDQNVKEIIDQIDSAILTDSSLIDLRDGQELGGDLLNDIVYMYNQGLLFDEIDAFVTSRIKDDYLHRKVAVNLLNRAAAIAPALGLFGTVIGLVGVLKSLSAPSQIGASMSLALMTTAYGAGLSSLVFTPLAGRLEHHNQIYLEVHRQLLSKIGVLLTRDERRLDAVNQRSEEVA